MNGLNNGIHYLVDLKKMHRFAGGNNMMQIDWRDGYLKR